MLEGIDFAGKTTQVAAIQKVLRQKGITSERFQFPDRRTPVGRLIHRVLRGRVHIPDAAMLALFSANRLEKREHILRALMENEFVLCDRYCESEYAYGGAKGLAASWLWALESLMPPADFVFLLDLDVGAASQRSRRGVARDTFESNNLFLDSVRSIYLSLAQAPDNRNWLLIDATRPQEEITEAIVNLLFQARTANQVPPAGLDS